MSWSKHYFFWILILLVLSCNELTKEQEMGEVVKYKPKLTSLINAKELMHEMSTKNEVVVIDFRKEEDYNKGHVPKAINIWRTEIESSAYPYKGMMASKQEIETLFSKLGIKSNDKLVIYDDRGSCDAARLWWVLSNYGFYDAQLLNGGLQSWKKTSGTISLNNYTIKPSSFKFQNKSDMDLYIGREELLNASTNQNNLLILDTRSTDEFSGKRRKNGAKKAGRIKNSLLIDWSNAINHNGDMEFKGVENLETTYGKFLGSKNDTIITYCHTGVRSAHTTFVLSELWDIKT